MFRDQILKEKKKEEKELEKRREKVSHSFAFVRERTNSILI